ncbi:hypothetical protein Tco_1202735 [Tanacetum coccineum]
MSSQCLLLGHTYDISHAEEEEHLASTDPAVVAFLADQDPYLAYREVAERLLALPTYIEGSLGSRAAGIRQRDALPSLIHETEIPEICLPLHKRPCHTAPTLEYEVGESLAAGAARQDGPATAGADLYGFFNMIDAAPGRQRSSELGYGITDTLNDLVGAIQELEDARHDRALLRGRVNMLYRDRPFYRRTALLMEEEARVSHAAWAQSMDACDQVHSEGISLQTTVMVQQSKITEL